MKKSILKFVILALCFQTTYTIAQKHKVSIDYINQDNSLDKNVEKKFKKIIYSVYPKLLKEYNPKATKHFTVVIDTAYKGVAYANNNQITVSANWMHKKANDFDLMTHEMMHLIQAYPHNSGPSWLTEGIADYVRYKYGVDNKSADWSLPNYSDTQKYTDSYRVSARFLVWVEEKHNKDFVKEIDKHLREKTYSEALWKEFTGDDLSTLWNDYTKDPTI